MLRMTTSELTAIKIHSSMPSNIGFAAVVVKSFRFRLHPIRNKVRVSSALEIITIACPVGANPGIYVLSNIATIKNPIK